MLLLKPGGDKITLHAFFAPVTLILTFMYEHDPYPLKSEDVPADLK